jgi:hypothetical protein
MLYFEICPILVPGGLWQPACTKPVVNVKLARVLHWTAGSLLSQIIPPAFEVQALNENKIAADRARG